MATNRDPARESSHAHGERSRREFLAGMRAAGAGLLLFGPMASAVSASPRDLLSRERLSVSDRQIAGLGARFARQDPAAARELGQWAASQLPRRSEIFGVRRQAAAARARLLDRARLADEFAREEVVLADGWLLARSEVALAVHLAHLAGGPDGSPQL